MTQKSEINNSVSNSFKAFLAIQFFGLFSIIYAFDSFASMGSANMGWLAFILFWGIPSLFQIGLALIDLFNKPIGAFSSPRKYFIIIVFLYFLLCSYLIFPFIENFFQFQEGYLDRLNGSGDLIIYIFLVFPNLIYFLLSTIVLFNSRELPYKSFIRKSEIK